MRVFYYILTIWAGILASTIGGLLSLLLPKHPAVWCATSLVGAMTGVFVCQFVGTKMDVLEWWPVLPLMFLAMVNDASRLSRRDGILRTKALSELIGDAIGYTASLIFVIFR